MKLFRKLIFYYLLFTISCLSFQSCVLEPDGPKNVIQPQILRIDGFHIASEELRVFEVSIGSVPVARPNAYGYCRFENVSLPYDLEATFSESHGEREVTYVYQELNIANPRVNPPFTPLGSPTNRFVINVNFPPVPQGKAGMIRFISRDLFSQRGITDLIYPPDSSAAIEIAIPFDKSSIEGKLILLQGEGEAVPYQMNMTSYDNFGMKDITLQAGFNTAVVFSPQDIQYNPQEASVDYTFPPPGNSFHKWVYVSLSFPGFNPCSDIILCKAFRHGEAYWTQTVPAGLGISYNIKISSTYWFLPYSYVADFKATAVVTTHPGSSVTIEHKKLELLRPQNNQENANENSYLTVKNDNKPGIYAYFIYSQFGTLLVVYTNKSSLRLGSLNYRTFKITPNTNYLWNACKISEFSSTDDFTERLYIFNEKFSSITPSDMWRFKTAP